MYPYLIVFFLSIAICAAGERVLEKSTAAGALLCCVSSLFPVVLAGARDYTVGTDVSTYGNYVYKAACNSKDLRILLRSADQIEPLYTAFAYAVSRFTHNAHIFYLITALLICGFTMAGLWYYRRWCSITLGWACFLFLFYGETLNVMRQCLALAIVFAAFPLFLEKRYVLFAVLSQTAILFHVTGLISLLLPLLYVFLKKRPPHWLQFLLIAACIGVILFYSPLLGIALDIHLLPAKFSRYIAKGIPLSLNPTLLRLPFLIPILVLYDRFCGMEVSDETAAGDPGKKIPSDQRSCGCMDSALSENSKADVQALGMLVVVLLFMELCTVQLRSVQTALYRISYYYGYYRFIAYPRLVHILRREYKAAAAVLLILYLVVIWYYQNVIRGNNQIVPYIYAPGWFDPESSILVP